jgi:hypothetical protein
MDGRWPPYIRPPSQQVSQMVRQLEHCSLPRISTSRPPHMGQAVRHVGAGAPRGGSGGTTGLSLDGHIENLSLNADQGNRP